MAALASMAVTIGLNYMTIDGETLLQDTHVTYYRYTYVNKG